MVTSDPAFRLKLLTTNTVTVSEFLQVDERSLVTIYVVVEEGDAMGLGQFVQLRPVGGAQLKTVPPVTFNWP